MSAPPVVSNAIDDAMAVIDPSKEVLIPCAVNGWTSSQEDMMADWADIAGSYRWMHDLANKRYSHMNMILTLPVIFLSTITGTANFAVGGIVDTSAPSIGTYIPAIIGSFSILAGILSTVGNFLRFAQLSEANRVASIAWGKLQRQISVEVRLPPEERVDCLMFIKLSRAEMDRLIEQSPAIQEPVIEAFEKEFRDVPSLKRPDIAHGISRTVIYKNMCAPVSASRQSSFASSIAPSVMGPVPAPPAQEKSVVSTSSMMSGVLSNLSNLCGTATSAVVLPMTSLSSLCSSAVSSVANPATLNSEEAELVSLVLPSDAAGPSGDAAGSSESDSTTIPIKNMEIYSDLKTTPSLP